MFRVLSSDPFVDKREFCGDRRRPSQTLISMDPHFLLITKKFSLSSHHGNFPLPN